MVFYCAVFLRGMNEENSTIPLTHVCKPLYLGLRFTQGQYQTRYLASATWVSQEKISKNECVNIYETALLLHFFQIQANFELEFRNNIS